MTGFNRVILLGNCVRDPELRYTPSGTAVTDFRLAVNRYFGSGENRKQETLFIDVQAWGKSAETLSRYLQKGNAILVEGRLVLDQWEANGERRSKIRVVAENFQFMPRSSSSGSSGSHAQERPSAPPRNETPRTEDDEEIPF